MSGDGETGERARARTRLRFDWYNHLTTLSLLVIGGIIGFVPQDPVPRYAVVALALVAAGGAAGLSGASRIAAERPLPTGWRAYLAWERYAAALLGFGAGVFISGFFLPLL